jgi:hypothetical protein
MASSNPSALLHDEEVSSFLFDLNSETQIAEELSTITTSTQSPPSTNTSANNLNNLRKRKRDSHKANSTWNHFRRAQGQEPDRAADGQRLWYCQSVESQRGLLKSPATHESI